MKPLSDRNEKKLAKKAYGKFEEFFAQAKTRLADYKEADQWMAGDPNLVWSEDRKVWQAEVFPNLLESTIRQKVALLTDNKPKLYVYTIPEVEMLDDPEMSELIKMHSRDMNMGFDHLWRFNKMHTILETMVMQGAQYGLMGGRCYWDSKAGNKGEIRTESLSPYNVFFDESVHRVDLVDGSTEWFVIAQPKPKSWFHNYFPNKELSDAQPNEYQDLGVKEGSISDYPIYSEIYHPAGELEDEELGTHKMMVTGMCGHKILYSHPMDYFPVFLHPYELILGNPMGGGDIKRLTTLQKDFCSKASQVSLNIALSANRQYIINPAKLGLSLGTLLQHSGEPGYIFVTKKLAEDVKNAIVDLETPKFNAELFQYLYFLPQLIEMVSGMSDILKGMAAKKERQSKYEVGKQYEAATIRVRNTAHHIEMLLVDMGLIWTKMIKKYWKTPRVIYRVNSSTDKLDTNIFNYPVDKKKKRYDLDYVLTVQPDSVLPIDAQSQAERDMQLAQMQMIDPRTLLETLNHPKVDAIVQRLQERAQEQAGPQATPGGQPPPQGAVAQPALF